MSPAMRTKSLSLPKLEVQHGAAAATLQVSIEAQLGTSSAWYMCLKLTASWDARLQL